MSAEEAKAYGIVDNILVSTSKRRVSEGVR
jgi:ATP-dependent protease ClpP protease subunit